MKTQRHLKPLFDPRNYSFRDVRDLSIRQINAAFRAADESRLWPVCGRFNATERAIRRLRRARRQGLCMNPGYEYVLSLEREIGEIVNAC